MTHDGGAHVTPRAVVRVDLDAVRDSVSTLRARAGAAEVMAVVKADGYGHGAVPCARAAVESGATWLGVAYVEEAQQLREAGLTAPVVVLVEPSPGAVRAAVAASSDVTAGSAAVLAEAVDVGRSRGAPTRVHLKVDTGLSRGGAPADAWPALCASAAAAERGGVVQVVGVWSHFACADTPTHPSVGAQLSAYRAALEVASAAGLRPEVRHLANSAATLALPESHFDLVRPGIAVYGLSPGAGVDTFGLRPAMTLAARVAMTKRVPSGTGVSYGHRYRTDAETTLALVPLGYADGLPRSASGVAEVLIGGRRRAIAGSVCMDQVVVDVGDDDVATGDEAVLFGPGNHGEPTADDWARALGTINYEVVTRIGARVPREYVGQGAA